MKEFLFLMICLLCIMATPADPAQPTVRPPGSSVQSSSEEDATLTFRGTVILNNRNEEIVLKEENRYYVIAIGKEQWKLGLAGGYEIVVRGKMDYKGIIGNEVSVSSIDVISKTKESGLGLALRPIGDVLDVFKEGEIVLTRGYVSDLTHRQMQISQLQRSIWIPFSNSDPIDHFNAGDEMIVLGILKTVHGQRVIDPIMVKPAARLQAKDTSAKPLKIHAILEQRPIGQEVKTMGRTALLIGKSQQKFVYDGADSIIVYPSEQYATLAIPLGTEVTVVGVFDTEQRDNQPVGVLRDARIDRFSLSR